MSKDDITKMFSCQWCTAETQFMLIKSEETFPRQSGTNCSFHGIKAQSSFHVNDAMLNHSVSSSPQVWVWEYPTDDGHADLFMDPEEPIRFRVTSETFVDTSPNTAPEGNKGQTQQQQQAQPVPPTETQVSREIRFCPHVTVYSETIARFSYTVLR